MKGRIRGEKEKRREEKRKGCDPQIFACSGPVTGARMGLVNGDCGQGQEWDQSIAIAYSSQEPTYACEGRLPAGDLGRPHFGIRTMYWLEFPGKTLEERK